MYFWKEEIVLHKRDCTYLNCKELIYEKSYQNLFNFEHDLHEIALKLCLEYVADIHYSLHGTSLDLLICSQAPAHSN